MYIFICYIICVDAQAIPFASFYQMDTIDSCLQMTLTFLYLTNTMIQKYSWKHTGQKYMISWQKKSNVQIHVYMSCLRIENKSSASRTLVGPVSKKDASRVFGSVV